jgi:hypothetical protein
MRKHDYPGRLRGEQWQALPLIERHALVKRAQCDLFGSSRYCSSKSCRRARRCASADPGACMERLRKAYRDAINVCPRPCATPIRGSKE